MSKKKLLIFIDWFYPGFKGGGQIVSCLNLVNEIYKEFDIFIFTRANDYLATTNYEDIKINHWQDFDGKAKIYYCDQKLLSLKKIDAIINEINPDILYVNSIFSYYFTLIPIFLNHFYYKKDLNRKVILVPRGMLMDGKLQFRKIKKIIYLLMFRILGLSKKVILQVTSEAERVATIKRLKLNDNQVYLIPNIPSKRLLSKQSITKHEEILRLFFASRIAREKNILFILDILKKINLPISLDIFGAIDHEDYWQLCEKVIQDLPTYIKVNYKGIYKSNDIQSVFQPYHAFIFPTFGENYGHVIIEALALAKPVITTPTTPWESIEENNAGWIIDLKDEEKYSNVLKELYYMDTLEYKQKADSAFEFAKKFMNKIDYRKIYNDFFLSI